VKRAFASVGIVQADIKPIERKRFLAKVRVRDIEDCWSWLAAKTRQGYGCFRLNGSSTTAQRVAYALFRGDLKPGLTVDHLCRNRSCVNPAHLEAVPHRVNIMRGKCITAEHARRTHCPRCGSELVWYIGPNHRQRYCAQCKRRNSREHARRVRGSDPARYRV
jgi:hypothetical protein